MQYKFKLEEEDYVHYQLFAASINDRTRKRRKLSGILLAVTTFVLALVFYDREQLHLTWYFGILSVVILFFYPKYTSWRYKRIYRKHVKVNFGDQFGNTIQIDLNDDIIKATNDLGSGEVKSSEVDAVYETGSHFLVNISNGSSLIFPKAQMKNQGELKNYFKKLKVPMENHIDWKWG